MTGFYGYANSYGLTPGYHNDDDRASLGLLNTNTGDRMILRLDQGDALRLAGQLVDLPWDGMDRLPADPSVMSAPEWRAIALRLLASLQAPEHDELRDYLNGLADTEEML